jgi:hypothetical protein
MLSSVVQTPHIISFYCAETAGINSFTDLIKYQPNSDHDSAYKCT